MVVRRRGKRDIGAVFEAHPAVTAHDYRVSHGTVGNKRGPCGYLCGGYATREGAWVDVTGP